MSLDSSQLASLFLSNSDSSSDFLELVLLQKDSEKVVFNALNSLLNNSKTRALGLELLQHLIQFCTSAELLEHVLEWSNFCMIHHAEDSEKELKLITLTKILENVSNVDLISKKFTSEYLTLILKASLVHQTNEEQVTNLRCLNRCMKKFPSWFGNHKSKLEAYLLGCLESPCEKVVESAASAFVDFLQTGPAGVNGVHYISNFEMNLTKFCSTLQRLLNRLLYGTGDVEEIHGEVVKFQDVAEDVTQRRLLNCLIFLKKMLDKSFSVEKKIVPKQIIGVISRGLSRHVCFSDVFSKKSLLKKIYLLLLRILKSFIQGYHSFLVPFSVLIETTIFDSFSRLHRCNCFAFDGTYKVLVYKVLIKWLTFNKPINDLRFQEKLAPFLLQDLTSSKKTVVLNLNKKVANELQQVERVSLFDELTQRKNCELALTVVQIVFRTSFTIDSNFAKEIVDLVVATLDGISRGQVVPPYDSIPCQMKLYEVLVSFLDLECKVFLPSLQAIIVFLNIASHHSNERIGQIATRGLELVEKISQPVCPTLHVCELAEERGVSSEISKRDEKKTEIEIIENILIRAPDSERMDESEVEELVDLTEGEVVEEEEAKLENSEEKMEEDVVEKKEEAEREEKGGEDDDDMFGSFQDVVQE